MTGILDELGAPTLGPTLDQLLAADDGTGTPEYRAWMTRAKKRQQKRAES